MLRHMPRLYAPPGRRMGSSAGTPAPTSIRTPDSANGAPIPSGAIIAPAKTGAGSTNTSVSSELAPHDDACSRVSTTSKVPAAGAESKEQRRHHRPGERRPDAHDGIAGAHHEDRAREHYRAACGPPVGEHPERQADAAAGRLTRRAEEPDLDVVERKGALQRRDDERVELLIPVDDGVPAGEQADEAQLFAIGPSKARAEH